MALFKKVIRVIGQLILVFVVGFAVIRVGAFLVGGKSNEEIVREVVKEVILKRPTCPDSSEAYQELKTTGKTLQLVKNLSSYGKDGFFVNEKVVITKRTGSGSQIACGYLYSKARVGNRSLRPDENFYVKPGQFGGHIEKDGAILFKEADTATSTEAIFNLSSVTYRPKRDAKEIEKADWSALLNVSDKTEFVISLNTISPLGLIEEISIVYKCWSPETGKETTDCHLAVE